MSIPAKFADYVGKGRIPAVLTFQNCWQMSRPIWLKPDARLAMAWLFKLPHSAGVQCYEACVSDNFSLIFITYAGRIVEICSWRSMRQMGKAWVKLWVASNPNKTQEADRLKHIFKFKFVRKMQGGLIRQEKCPRISPIVRAYKKEHDRRKADAQTSVQADIAILEAVCR